MAQQLMAQIRLWSVQWSCVVPDVLRRKEDTKGKPIQKVPGAQEASYWTHLEVGPLFQEGANILLLWDIVVTISTVSLEKTK